MSQSSGSRASRKAVSPKKPYADFPLSPHRSGMWQKKIRGKIHYFGRWGQLVDGVLTRVEGDGWKEALAQYKRVADDLHAGRTPRVRKDGELTVADLCNRFLTAKLRKVEAGELSTVLFADYRTITDLLTEAFGTGRPIDDLAADDFADLRARMAKKWGPVRLGNSITRVKSVFKFGYETGAMERPVRYGPEFVKPDKSVLRRHKAKMPVKMFEANEVRSLIDGTDVVKPDATIRAMILLGVNCGFGNTDCAELPTGAVNLNTGWIDFPRPKTGIARRCPLWPETVAALRTAFAERPKSKSPADAGRAFLTMRGTPFAEQTERGNKKDLVGVRFTTLIRALGLHRPRVGFYSLRHVFETIAGDSKDQVAVDIVMGHSDPSMASAYRERIDDVRLRAVADHVRAWAWPAAG